MSLRFSQSASTSTLRCTSDVSNDQSCRCHTTGTSELSNDQSYTDITANSNCGASSISNNGYSASNKTDLSEDTARVTSTRGSEISVSATRLLDDSHRRCRNIATTFPITSSNAKTAFRRRSPCAEEYHIGVSNRYAESPRSMAQPFQRPESEKATGVCTIEEEGSEDAASIIATIEDRGPEDNLSTHVLHQVCLSASDPEGLWRNIALVTLSNTRTTDEYGRLPLHCLSYNTVLIDNIAHGSLTTISKNEHIAIRRSFTMNSGRVPNSARERVSDFVNQLFVHYPDAMRTEEKSGYIPFEGILQEWVNQMTQSSMHGCQLEPILVGEPFSLWAKSIQRFGRHLETLRSANRSQWSDAVSSDDIESTIPAFSEHDDLPRNHATPVLLTAAAHFAFHMVSCIIDHLNKKQEISEATRRRSRSDPFHVSSESMEESGITRHIIRKIACIPRLLYVVLLLEDEEQRLHVLSTTIMKSVLASRFSVDNWLTEMLQSSDKRIIDCGIEYLRIVSGGAYDNSGGIGHGQYQDTQYSSAKAEVAEAISGLEGFVPSLLSLSERHVEEAATTKVVRRVLDKIMARRFCVTIAFCDGLFLATQITGFRLAVNSLVVGKEPSEILTYLYIANVGLFYFVLRELGKGKSVCTKSLFATKRSALTESLQPKLRVSFQSQRTLGYSSQVSGMLLIFSQPF